MVYSNDSYYYCLIEECYRLVEHPAVSLVSYQPGSLFKESLKFKDRNFNPVVLY